MSGDESAGAGARGGAVPPRSPIPRLLSGMKRPHGVNALETMQVGGWVGGWGGMKRPHCVNTLETMQVGG